MSTIFFTDISSLNLDKIKYLNEEYNNFNYFLVIKYYLWGLETFTYLYGYIILLCIHNYILKTFRLILCS